MDIQGLDYNTAREKLMMTEYGREIQKMIDIAIDLPTKEERMRCALTIIHQMEMKNPQVRESEDYQQTLWDHLYLMSHKQLDIDHYGQLLTKVFEQLKTMPEGVERDELVRLTANQMKRDLMTWGHGSMDDEKVADDLARFTDGKIQLDLSTFRFDHINAIVPDSGNGKRKKKK